MLFTEKDAPLLKTWIVKRIENTSDADAEVLAEYIIALLRHDGDKESVRQLCEQEIPDFLTEDTKIFLDDVFQAIAYRSYLPGAPPPPPKFQPNPPPSQPQKHKETVSQDKQTKSQPGSKKRGYRDLDAPTAQEPSRTGSRPPKNPRKGARGGKGGADGSGRGGLTSAMAIPPFDPQNSIPMEAFMALGMPFPTMPPVFGAGTQGGASKRRDRCRDFDKKGYCSRGATCPYEHGNESLYHPQMPMQMQMPMSLPMPGEGEFNPQETLATLAEMQNFMNQFQSNLDSNNNTRGRRGRGKAQRTGKNGASRASFSADGPVLDKSKTTIVVENIPQENFTDEEVRAFFSQFGTILDISMQPYKHLAVVKYDTWASANAAYRSPKAIFENRFVKVFWYKDGSEAKSQTTGANSHPLGGDKGEGELAEPVIDMEDFHRKQDEAQKQFHERELKRSQIEQRRLELEEKQKALMEKHRQETQKLQAKLHQKKTGHNNGNNDTNDTAVTLSGTDALRAKLEELEREAKILGIDPNIADDNHDPTAAATYSSSSGYNNPGPPYARGGGSFRARGGRGRGGGYRGGGGSLGVEGRHAAYAQYSIDNRPKRLAITGVDFTAPEKDESLRHYLLNLGEFESVDSSPSITYVSFQDRRQAEKLYNSLNGREVPGVQGKLELQWVNGTTTGNSANVNGGKGAGFASDGRTAITSKVVVGEEEDEEEGEVQEDEEDDLHHNRHHQHEVMDYERPDDNGDDDAY